MNVASSGQPSGLSAFRFVELSHRLTAGMQTYPGLPLPEIRYWMTFEQSQAFVADGQEFSTDQVTVVGCSGTYIDSPRHFLRDGADVASLAIESLVDLPAVVVPAPSGRREYQPDDFAEYPIAGHAVLLRTGWSERWGTDGYASDSPFLGRDAALHLRDSGVALVGIDALLLDDIADTERPDRAAHVTLLSAGVPIVENLAELEGLPARGALFSAVPARVAGVGSFPVRAYARIPSAP